MYYILICKFSFVENISIQFHIQFSMIFWFLINLRHFKVWLYGTWLAQLYIFSGYLQSL